MEQRVEPEARAGFGQHFHIITAALHAHFCALRTLRNTIRSVVLLDFCGNCDYKFMNFVELLRIKERV